MGIRVIKTAISVISAVYLAQWLGLHSPLGAGLLAILGVEVTKKKGLQSVFQRMVASIFGLLFASLLFWLLGFHVWVIGLFVLGLYPILSRLQLQGGIVTSSVVMFHLFGAGAVSVSLIFNEIGLLLAGLGTATLINIVYMPRAESDLIRLRTETEAAFSAIFREIASHLRDAGHIWDGTELLAAERAIEAGRELARRSNENMLLGGDARWLIYFEMRKTQLYLIGRMLELIAQVYETLPHGELMAVVFEELSNDVKIEYYTGRSEAKLLALEQQYKKMPLPAAREEFEIRSALLQICVELRTYLSISKRDKKKIAKKTDS